MYRCEANNVSAFIRQLAVGYVCRGYFFYVQGRIPEGKDPTKTDEKIIGQYGIAQSKWAKARGRKRGEASIQYLRHGREFVILATHGGHRFFTDEARRGSRDFAPKEFTPDNHRTNSANRWRCVVRSGDWARGQVERNGTARVQSPDGTKAGRGDERSWNGTERACAEGCRGGARFSE